MNKRRIVARILAVLMAFTMLPQTAIVAMAEEGDQGTEQKTVTITYAVEGNGSVDPASETVDLENLEIKGSTATAEDGYEFVNWTNGAGEEVTTEAKITPAATDVTEDVTYTAHFQEKKVEKTEEEKKEEEKKDEEKKPDVTPDPQPENPVTITITYAAGENGSVKVTGTESDTTESFQSGDTTYTIKGATATANEGYEFVNWTVVDGEETKEVSTEAAYTPAATKVTKDVTYTANFKEKAQPVTPSKAPAAPSNDGTVTSPADVEAGKAYVVSKAQSYGSLRAAIEAAEATDTIYLGKGVYYSCDAETWSSQVGESIAEDKELTIVGQGSSETIWNVGTPDNDRGSEANSDYSLSKAKSITFENLTLNIAVKWSDITNSNPSTQNRNYTGFSHIENGSAATAVKNCVINGRSAYWGYTSATFENTTFNAPSYDYALWTYSSPTMTFDGCTFNTSGKVINVYTDYARASYTINYKDCTVNNSSSFIQTLLGSTKQVMNINDSNLSEKRYTINISGNNTITGGQVLSVDNMTCSRLFGFGSDSGKNTGRTIVNIEGTTVFESGKLIDHEHGTISGGTYSNNKASNNTYDYSEGHKDGAYTTEVGEWTTDPTTGLKTRKTVKKCNYCNWSSEKQETETETKDLPGDILIDGDTEHSAVAKRDTGATFSLTGALQVSSVLDQMSALETLFNSPAGSSITLSDVNFGFTATLTVPEGISLPTDVKVNAEGMSNTYKVDSTSVDGKKVTVTFALTDDAKSKIKTYADLKQYVGAAGVDGWLKVTIPNCKVDSNVEAGKRLTVTGTVGGSFSATATSQYGTARSFSYEWNGTQWADGKDAAAAADNNAIQLTIEVTVPSTPEEPETPSTPDNNDDGGDEPAPQGGDSTPAPAVAPTVEPVVEITESGNEGETTEETVEEVSEGGSAGDEQVVEITEGGAIAATGDESPIVLYGMVTLMAGAALVLWASKRRAR